MDLLHGLTYVTTKKLTDEKGQLIAEINEVVDEMKLIKAGKKTARNPEDFLNER